MPSGRLKGSRNRDWSKERAVLNRVRNQIQARLDEILVDPLLVSDLKMLKLGKIKFDENGFHADIEGVFAGKQSHEERYYEELRTVLALPTHVHGFDHDLPVTETKPGIRLPPLQTYITPNGRGTVRVIGARPKGGRTKFNIICLRSDGARVFYRAEDIARMAQKQGAL